MVPDNNPEDFLGKLHAEQLNLSKALIDVCERHGLKLFACYGTLLGVIRHKGFIPWDDDVDFVMFREDYDKLISLPASEFPAPYKLEDRVTIHRFMNPETTFIQQSKSRFVKGRSYGVWVDVFCLDAVPKDERAFQKLCKKVRSRQRLLVNYQYRSYAQGGLISKLYHLFSRLYFSVVNPEKENNRIQNLLRENTLEHSDHLIEYGVNLTYTKVEKLKKYKKCWFDGIEWLPFESIKLPCPVGWDEILSLKYGDYMTPRPGPTVHGKVQVDLYTPGHVTMEKTLANLPWYKRYWHTH